MSDYGIYNEIIRKMSQNLNDKEQILAERKAEIYELIPEISEIDKKLKSSVLLAARNAFENEVDVLIELDKIREFNLSLSQRKTELLLKNNFSKHYLTLKYDCDLCNDLGYIGSNYCDCVKNQAKEVHAKSISHILDIKHQNFELFDFNFYSDVPDKRLNISPRQNIKYNYAKCKDFTQNFGCSFQNLLMFGAPGLGKTFLSTCIAKEISTMGHSVIYDTISSVLEHFERDKFSSDELSRVKIQNYYNADLLIIDDLGSEMSTAFTLSSVYSLLNRRLMLEKPMIINTNLNIVDISRRYNDAIASRLDGNFLHLRFFGDDIRRLKKLNLKP